METSLIGFTCEYPFQAGIRGGRLPLFRLCQLPCALQRFLCCSLFCVTEWVLGLWASKWLWISEGDMKLRSVLISGTDQSPSNSPVFMICAIMRLWWHSNKENEAKRRSGLLILLSLHVFGVQKTLFGSDWWTEVSQGHHFHKTQTLFIVCVGKSWKMALHSLSHLFPK